MSRIFSIFFIVVLLASASGAQNDFNRIIWKELTPENSPAGRFHHAMVYDSDQDRIVLFGGNVDGTMEDITWSYDYNTNTWSNRQALHSPDGLNYHAMAFDSENKKTVLFGGYTQSPSILQDKTWSYDFVTNNWTEMEPANAPSARRSPNMVYDEVNNRVILFGGQAAQPGGGLAPSDETWSYDFTANNWTRITATPSPPARIVPAMTYDPVNQQIIMVGGNINYHGEYLNDTWLFDVTTDTWKEIESNFSPVRGEMDLVFDTSIGQGVLYGGYSGEQYYDDLWTFAPDSLTWKKHGSYSGGPGPLATEQSMVFSSQHNVTLFYGGGVDGERVDTTWSLAFEGEPSSANTADSSVTDSVLVSPWTVALTLPLVLIVRRQKP